MPHSALSRIKRQRSGLGSFPSGLLTASSKGPRFIFKEHSATLHGHSFPVPEIPGPDTLTDTTSGTESTANQKTKARHFEVNQYSEEVRSGHIVTPIGKWMYLSCPDSPVICTDCQCRPGHIDCIVVSISSTYPIDPRISQSISISVYFGPGNEHNICNLFNEVHCTAQVASLKSCLAALCKCWMFHTTWQSKRSSDMAGKMRSWPLNTVVIKSDSEYLVKGITEWLPKWKLNKWKNCRGQPVANEDLWRVIDGMIVQLEGKIKVQFWLVDKAQNADARSLAPITSLGI